MSKKNIDVEKELYKYFKVKKRELTLKRKLEYSKARIENLKEIMQEFIDDPKEFKKYYSEIQELKLEILKVSVILSQLITSILRIKIALEFLSDKHRHLIELRYNDKLSYDKIAEIQYISRSTVLRRNRDVLEEIKSYL